MHLIIHPQSMVPIWEQICAQIKNKIQSGELKAGDGLPSVRAVARECQISALTVKKAYDALEKEGLIITVQGKGSFIADVSPGYLQESLLKQAEEKFADGIALCRQAGLDEKDIEKMIALLLEDS